MIVTNSTVPVDTGDEVERIVREERPLGSKSARISQIIDRYGMLVRTHQNDDLLAIAQNEWLSYCVAGWAEVYPVPHTNSV